jgi:hypothetical protein
MGRGPKHGLSGRLTTLPADVLDAVDRLLESRDHDSGCGNYRRTEAVDQAAAFSSL